MPFVERLLPFICWRISYTALLALIGQRLSDDAMVALIGQRLSDVAMVVLIGYLFVRLISFYVSGGALEHHLLHFGKCIVCRQRYSGCLKTAMYSRRFADTLALIEGYPRENKFGNGSLAMVVGGNIFVKKKFY